MQCNAFSHFLITESKQAKQEGRPHLRDLGAAAGGIEPKTFWPGGRQVL